MTEIIAETNSSALPAILSGPSFAADVARGLPTAVTLACADEAIAAALARALGSQTFRPYHTTDVRGVEIGGAAKNVLAIAAGIVAGRKLGASATAALVTRGFAELARFGRALGARSETLTGLSGLGDLILTCSSPQSRNFSLGIALGEGRAPEGKLAEGAFTARALAELAGEKGVEMPIAAAVAAVIEETLTVDQAIEGLLTRPFRLKRKAGLTLGAFPSPLRGGVRSGGPSLGQSRRSKLRPPPRAHCVRGDPPRKGEGKDGGRGEPYCCFSPSSSMSCFCSPICCIA